MSPFVSVCLPAYNAERYVESAIRSVLGQTYTHFELLILDDGSLDRTPELLARLGREDARIVIESRPNRGLVQTLNQLFDKARGEYIARMDADDLCRPERFARQVAYLEAHPECVAVGSRAMFIDPEGLPLTNLVDAITHEEIEAALMKPILGMLHPASMIRRSAIVRAGGPYREEFPHAEDLDLFLRLAEVGRLYNLPDILLDYRCHVSSVSHLHTVRQSEVAHRAVDAALERRGVQPGARSSRAAPASLETSGQLHRKWAWWALHSGFRKSACKHAAIALKVDPLSRENLNLIATVLRATVAPRR